MHFKDTISAKASGFLANRTGTSEQTVLVDQNHRGGEGRAVKGVVYFLFISAEALTLTPGQGGSLRSKELGKA